VAALPFKNHSRLFSNKNREINQAANRGSTLYVIAEKHVLTGLFTLLLEMVHSK